MTVPTFEDYAYNVLPFLSGETADNLSPNQQLICIDTFRLVVALYKQHYFSDLLDDYDRFALLTL